MLHLARAHGAANPMFRNLQRGYFAGELDPFDGATLVRVAAEAGVPAGETSAVLDSDGYAEAVRREQAAGRALGITGVPFVVLDGAYAVAGAQPVEGYAAAIRTALAGQPARTGG